MSRSEALFLLLAKTYLLQPKFLIADEPFTGLTNEQVWHAFAIMRKLQERGTGILVTDHNAKTMLEIADFVHIIDGGDIVFSGSVDVARSSIDAERLYFRRRAKS